MFQTTNQKWMVQKEQTWIDLELRHIEAVFEKTKNTELFERKICNMANRKKHVCWLLCSRIWIFYGSPSVSNISEQRPDSRSTEFICEAPKWAEVGGSAPSVWVDLKIWVLNRILWEHQSQMLHGAVISNYPIFMTQFCRWIFQHHGAYGFYISIVTYKI